MIAWGVVFSQSFSGLSGDVWDVVEGSGSGKSHLLTGLQLLCELFVAAGLALALEEIHRKYDDDAWDTNHEFLRTQDALNRHLLNHAELCKKRDEKKGRLNELTSKRDAYINAYVVEYSAKRVVDQSMLSL